MPPKSQLSRHLSRLEKFFDDPKEQDARESMFPEAGRLTPTERRARIRTLSGRLMLVRCIQATCGETMEDAAVRALHTIMATPSSGMIAALRTAYRDVGGDVPRAT
jgi:hypothetical protein